MENLNKNNFDKDKNIIQEDENGEYIWKDPNYDPRAKASQEYVKLNRNFENLYENYTKKAKYWPIYAHGTFKVESKDTNQIKELIADLKQYAEIMQFREKSNSDSSIISKLDILEEVLENKKEVDEELISLARKTLDDFTDLFMGLVPLKDLKHD